MIEDLIYFVLVSGEGKVLIYLFDIRGFEGFVVPISHG